MSAGRSSMCVMALLAALLLNVTAASADSPSKLEDGQLRIVASIVDESGAPVTGKSIYLFKVVKNALMTEFKEGVLSNPRGESDEDGRFELITPPDYLKVDDQFTLGPDPMQTLKSPDGIPAIISVGDIPETKTLDMGEVHFQE